MPKYLIVLFIIFENGEKSIFHVFQENEIEQAINMKEHLEEWSKRQKIKEKFDIKFYYLKK